MSSLSQQTRRHTPLLLLFLGVLSFSFQGCVSYKNQIFFQGLQDTTYNASMQQPDPVLQRGDQLMIMVYAFDQQSAQYFNQPMGVGGNNNMMQNLRNGGGGLMGYLVNEEGEIEFPKLGTINVLGYTQQALRDSLQLWLLPYLKDPIINVRIINFRVTYITADRAATSIITNNKTNILQFLGDVGGVNWMDKRDNIIVVRQVNDVRQVLKVDLTDASVFNSPAFYLQPNDIIYVEPNSRKFLETNIQLLSYITTISSTLSILLLFINNMK